LNPCAFALLSAFAFLSIKPKKVIQGFEATLKGFSKHGSRLSICPQKSHTNLKSRPEADWKPEQMRRSAVSKFSEVK
jgi:hypothetical protein